jgi:hypothetical protein
MGRGLATALSEHAKCEGTIAAVKVAEGWHTALEDMAEQGNEHQREAIAVLMQPIKFWLVKSRPLHEKLDAMGQS